jgi:hypothetical protein
LDKDGDRLKPKSAEHTRGHNTVDKLGTYEMFTLKLGIADIFFFRRRRRYMAG